MISNLNQHVFIDSKTTSTTKHFSHKHDSTPNESLNVFRKQVGQKQVERIRLNAIIFNLCVPADEEITFERVSIGEIMFFKTICRQSRPVQ